MTRKRSKSGRLVPRCPICGGRGRRDKPQCRLLDATCTSCGWHYTTQRPTGVTVRRELSNARQRRRKAGR